MIAGDADVSISGGIHTPFVESGELVVLLNLLGEGDLMATPGLPSSQELYGVSLENNLVISGPAGMPAEIVAKLEEAVAKAAESDRHTEVMETIQYPVVYRNSAEATAKLVSQAEDARELLAN